MAQKTLRERTSIEQFLLNNGWVILFIITCLILFEQGIKERNHSFATLSLQLNQLEAAKIEAIAEQQELLLQVNSQSDPEWVELILIQKLGLVPEGSIKVFFTKQS